MQLSTGILAKIMPVMPRGSQTQIPPGLQAMASRIAALKAMRAERETPRMPVIPEDRVTQGLNAVVGVLQHMLQYERLEDAETAKTIGSVMKQIQGLIAKRKKDGAERPSPGAPETRGIAPGIIPPVPPPATPEETPAGQPPMGAEPATP